MKTIIFKALQYLKSALSEANGTGSSTRLNLLLLTLGWIVIGAPIMAIKDLHQFVPLYLELYATTMTIYITGKVYKDMGTKNTTAQGIPAAPDQPAPAAEQPTP